MDTRVIQFALLLLLLVFGFSDSFVRLAIIWQQQYAYSHGWMLAAVSLFLTVRLLVHERGSCQGRAWPGVIILLSSLALWFVARASTVQVLELAALPAIVLATIGVTFGWRVLKRAILPVGLLYWAIPIWDFLTDYAQGATIWAVSQLLAVAGMTAYVEGSTVYVRAGQFEIESGCSGIYYLIVASAIGAIYASLYVVSWQRRLVAIGASALAAIVMNWIRVFSIVVVGDVTDMQHYLVSVDHYWYGWGLFVVMLLPLFLLLRHIENGDHRESIVGDVDSTLAVSSAGRATMVPFLVAIAAMAVVPLSFSLAKQRIEALPLPVVALPESLAGWSLDTLVSFNWQPEFRGVAAERTAAYRNQNGSVGVYRNVYNAQSQGRELVNYENQFFTQDYHQIRRDATGQSLAENELIQINEVEFVRGKENVLLLYSFVVDGRVIAEPSMVKWLQLKAFFKGRPAGGVLALVVNCPARCTDERERLFALMDLLIESISSA